MRGRGLPPGRPDRRVRPKGIGVLLVLLLATGSTPARAQVVRGWVLRADHTPVPDAAVVLRAENDSVVARATADPRGWFELRPRSRGPMRLEASSLGYADWETAMFELAADADVEVLITLQLAPIPLEELQVEAPRRQTTRRLADFERRREIQAFGGHFLVEGDIARRPASRPSNLVLGTPGMTVAGGRGPFDFYTIMSGDCVATVFIDGVRINQELTSVDEYLELPRIAGVEVYPRGMSAPPQYQGARSAECGTVLYWTKDLEPDAPGGWSTTKVVLGVASFTGLLLLTLAR